MKDNNYLYSRAHNEYSTYYTSWVRIVVKTMYSPVLLMSTVDLGFKCKIYL